MKIERETQEYLHYFCDTVITLCEVWVDHWNTRVTWG